LAGWGPMAEHQLMTLESCFSFAFPNSVMPYLDFLSAHGIESNPYSIFQHFQRGLQGEERFSPLRIGFVEAGLRTVGEAYLAHLRANPALFYFEEEKVAGPLHSALLTLLDQHFAMAESPEDFGDAIQSEAGAIVIDRLLDAILEKDIDVSFSYPAFTSRLVGSTSFVRAQMARGVREDQLMRSLQSHWEHYLIAACGDSRDLPESNHRSKAILGQVLS